ncbi:MAG: cytochrome c [Verrucomicrobiales bacterium]|nr:cytochrome c [Verrucomicrobiales bacterium]
MIRADEFRHSYSQLTRGGGMPGKIVFQAMEKARIGMIGGVLSFFIFFSPARADESSDAQRRELHLYLQGRYLFQKHCTTCHGTTGRGDGPWAEGLTDKPRNFRSGIFKFRSTAFGTLPTDDDLRRTIRSGISGTAMPFFKDITDENVEALIVYIRSLSRNWNKEELAPVPVNLPERPDWFQESDELVSHRKRGGKLFATHCAVCHGPSGDGDGPGAEGLVDVWEEISRPAKLSEPHHKSGDAPTDLYRTIATGLNGTPMIGYAGLLKEDEIWDLVSFIETLSES